MSGFVFLGPTLHRTKARKLLRSAEYLPPVNGGDILSMLKYKPSYLAVIDGNFGTKPSVWHKEILYALCSGCAVLGAASMGALRAAELSNVAYTTTSGTGLPSGSSTETVMLLADAGNTGAARSHARCKANTLLLPGIDITSVKMPEPRLFTSV